MRACMRAALLLPTLLAGCGGASAPAPPDILLVVVDDWSLSDFEAVAGDDDPWNDLPVIDRLADAGQSWRSFHSQPVCASARMTLMFGRYHGDTLVGSCAKPGPHTPPASTPSLASVLKDAGYATGAFGKWHVASHPDPSVGFEHAPGAYGFDTWRAMSPSNVGGHCHSTDYLDWYRVDDGAARQSERYHTAAVAEAARDWWSETSGPKFAYVAFQAPHQPLHDPPAEFLPEGYPTPDSRRAQFEAMLVAMDRALGELLSVVDLERTFVFVLGDNGTPSAAALPDVQNPRRMKATTYADGVNVPLVVRGPGVSRGRPRALGHVVDLLATLAELGGARVPAGLDSVSLAPVLADPGARVRDHLVCDYITPDRGEASRTRQILEQQGLPFERSRRVCVVLEPDPGSGSLVKGRWVSPLDSDALEEEFTWLPRDARTAPLEETTRERLRGLYRDYLARYPYPVPDRP